MITSILIKRGSDKNKQLMKKYLNIIKILLTIGIIWYIFYQIIDIEQLKALLPQIGLSFLGVALLLSIINRILNAWQTKIIHELYDKSLTTYSVLKAQFIATFWGIILPGDLAGNAVAWHLLAKENGQRAELASTIIFMRIINTVALLPFVCLGLLFEPKLFEAEYKYLIFIFIIFTLAMMLPFISNRIARIFEIILAELIKKMPFKKYKEQILGANGKFWDAIKLYKTLGKTEWTVISALAVIIQFTMVLVAFYTFETVNMELPFSVSLWLSALLIIINLLPVTFMGIGVRDITLIGILGLLYGTTAESCILFSTVTLLINVILAIIGAVFSFTMKSKS